MMFILIKTTAISIVATALIILALPLTAQAQEAKPARIGFLGRSEPPAANLAGFRKGMRDRGHIEGHQFIRQRMTPLSLARVYARLIAGRRGV